MRNFIREHGFEILLLIAITIITILAAIMFLPVNRIGTKVSVVEYKVVE